ncbi:MAG: hypothetical protein HY808_11085 [Nitrospirae bacterium]|nr:hypothetical protein [Nitrospirota bacterium]
MPEFLKGIETGTFLIKEGSQAAGHSVKELALRAETGATIIAVQRAEEVHQNPAPGFVLRARDIVLLIGKKKDINKAMEYLGSDKIQILKYHR